uniref:EB domain-containing protein n=1 Tax=Heterorhabditis bacteriophora TaxID=37862 RepID=A0A1I7XVN8_HETBA
MNIGLNLPCNKELDGLLAEDPNGNSNAFLSCKGVGMGNVGFWERMVCPNDMIFDFINQQCRTEKKKSRNPPTLNIAILNNSCAKNEICIGGTVCDVNSLKCLCPYGTTPQMDTLSCIKTDSSFINTDTQPFSFNSFSSLEKSPISGGLIPSIPQSTEAPNFFQPNNFKFNSQFGLSTNLNSFSGANNFDVKSSNYGVKNNYGGIPSNGDQTNSLDTSKWNLNMLPTHLMNGGFSSAINSFGIDFKPNPNSQQNFVFRPNTMNSFQPTEIKITTPHNKKVPVLGHKPLTDNSFESQAN